MHRFFSPEDAGTGGILNLNERDSAHAVRVLRLEKGDRIEVLNGSGRVLECRIEVSQKQAVVAEVTGERHVAKPPSIRLVPAILKAQAMDFLIQKATELGVGVVAPALTTRSVVRVGSRREAASKAEGWRRTAVEACKQCGNPWLPRIEEPEALMDCVAQRAAGPLLAAFLDPGARRLGEVAVEWGGVEDEVTLAIGPEGDFTTEEQQALRDAGAVPVSLGPLVLRAETAAIAALAVLLAGRDLARGKGVDAERRSRS